jgi:hypothetical protein
MPMARSEWQPQLREHVRAIGLIRAREPLAEGEFRHAHYEVAREEIAVMEGRRPKRAKERLVQSLKAVNGGSSAAVSVHKLKRRSSPHP